LFHASIGQQLLRTIGAWARAEDLELLLVWSSERAYPSMSGQDSAVIPTRWSSG